MTSAIFLYSFYALMIVVLIRKTQASILLSMAKHPSLRGHAKMSRLVAKYIPYYAYTEEQFYNRDGAPKEIIENRQRAFADLCEKINARNKYTLTTAAELENTISDAAFVNAYRVPFQFRKFISETLQVGTMVEASAGNRLKNMDSNWSYDLGGSYGVNVFGYDFYKDCLDSGIERVKAMGPVLGAYHPVALENARKLKQISNLDEVSFHMSGTEAVMQAVRLARYHTRRAYLVRFCGAYHGWWDGVQPGIGNTRKTRDVLTLKEMDQTTVKVLKTRNDVACVLVNPIQALHPNGNPPGDAMLINSERSAGYDRESYKKWLHALRKICEEKQIVFIMDDVFLGFRLAYGGSQEYFGLQADMVTYGKTLGGGLPVGVLCGKKALMKRYRDDKPTDVCFARGTFNSHPYVMGAMSAFLEKIEAPEIKQVYSTAETIWNERITRLNHLFMRSQLPLRIVNMLSICTILYTQPSRYNWLLQYYLRAHGLSMSWIGTGRIIMSHNLSDAEFDHISSSLIAAATQMKVDGWWWQSPELTDKSIKKTIVRELIAAFLKRKITPPLGQQKGDA